jgi:hypothetical protein
MFSGNLLVINDDDYYYYLKIFLNNLPAAVPMKNKKRNLFLY